MKNNFRVLLAKQRKKSFRRTQGDKYRKKHFDSFVLRAY